MIMLTGSLQGSQTYEPSQPNPHAFDHKFDRRANNRTYVTLAAGNAAFDKRVTRLGKIISKKYKQQKTKMFGYQRTAVPK